MHTSNEIIKLSDLRPDELAILVPAEDNTILMQIMNMGCIPGEEIIIKRVGAFGDPIAFEVCDITLSIRLEDAQEIEVQKCRAQESQRSE